MTKAAADKENNCGLLSTHQNANSKVAKLQRVHDNGMTSRSNSRQATNPEHQMTDEEQSTRDCGIAASHGSANEEMTE